MQKKRKFYFKVNKDKLIKKNNKNMKNYFQV